jgi:hypothetical protein
MMPPAESSSFAAREVVPGEGFDDVVECRLMVFSADGMPDRRSEKIPNGRSKGGRVGGASLLM